MIYLVAFLAFIGLSLAYEAFAIVTGRRTITGEFRELQRAHPGPTALLVLGLGILIGHFFWYQ